MLSLLRLKDIGPFAEAELALGAITVIVGPNNSGKTTLLRAMACLADSDPKVVGDGSRPKNVWAARSIDRRHGSDQAGQITWQSGTGPSATWQARLEVGRGPGWPSLVMSLLGRTFDERPESPQALPEGTTGTRGYTFPWGLIRDWQEISHPEAATSAALRAPGATLASMRWFSPHPDELRLASAAGIDGDVWLAAYRGGFGLASALANLAAADPERAFGLTKQFRKTFPEFKRYQVSPVKVSSEGPTVDGYRLSFPLASGGELTVEQVSDGVLLYLALLLVVSLPDPPSVLLFEEPEQGVHPSRLTEMVKVLRRFVAETGRQVVITTHMPYLLDLVEPSEAHFCYRGNDGHSRCARFADVADIADELEYKLLGELWAEHGETGLAMRLPSPR